MAEPNTTPLTVEQQYDLITNDLQEIPLSDVPRLKALLKERNEKGEPVRIYWGTATTGKPHFGYLVPIFKISDFLAAGCHVTILFADIHAYLDDMKSPWDVLQHRCEFYEKIIKAMLSLVGCPLEKLHFVKGSDFELDKKYTLDVLKVSAMVTTHDTIKAGAAVVRQTKTPKMSSLLYPILQALDEEYLGVDCQFGGVDQRKIFMFAKEQLPRIGYKKRIHLMNPLIPGLTKDGKMSSSITNSKIDFDDSDDEIKRKISCAYSIDGVAENNGMLCMLKYVLWRRLCKKEKPGLAVIQGDKIAFFSTYAELEEAFTNKTVTSKQLKASIVDELIELIKPLRKVLEESKALLAKAYPVDEEEQKRLAALKSVVTKAASITDFEIKVGKIVQIEPAKRGNKLYLCKIDVGEDEPREVCAGLRQLMTIDKLQDKTVLVVSNLPQVKLMGFPSNGMILVGSVGKKEFALVEPPQGVELGEVITYGSLEGSPLPSASLTKKKIAKILSFLKTDADGMVMWKTTPLITSKGNCKSLPNANVS